jgi:hypothetical protein
MPEIPVSTRRGLTARMTPKDESRVLLLGAIGALIVLVVVGVLIGTRWQPSTGLSFETAKLILQAIFIGGLGIVAGLIVDIVKKRAEARHLDSQMVLADTERERREAMETITSFLERTDAVYEEVKRVRRRLRLKAGAWLENIIEKEEFSSVAVTLDEEQMRLEQVIRDVETLKDRVRELAPIAAPLESMEKYLGDIWKETEAWFASLDGPVLVLEHPRLTGFSALNSDEKSDFGRQFNAHYHDTRRILVRALSDRMAPESDPVA